MFWIILYLALCFSVLGGIVILGILISRRYRSYRSLKSLRFEAGNPPMDRVRKKLIMQYFGFIFMAVCLECVFLYFLILSTCGEILKYSYMLAMCIVVIVLSVIVGLRYSSKLEEWI